MLNATISPLGKSDSIKVNVGVGNGVTVVLACIIYGVGAGVANEDNVLDVWTGGSAPAWPQAERHININPTIEALLRFIARPLDIAMISYIIIQNCI